MVTFSSPFSRFFQPIINEPHYKKRTIRQFFGSYVPSEFQSDRQGQNHTLKCIADSLEIQIPNNKPEELALKFLVGQTQSEKVYQTDEGDVQDWKLRLKAKYQQIIEFKE